MQGRRFQLRERFVAAGLADPDTIESLRLILDGGELGAARHVELTHELLVRLAAGGAGAWSRVRITGDLIAETRGREAPILANAVDWLLDAADGLPSPERAAWLADRARSWLDEAMARRGQLIEAAVMLLGERCRLITFDYSSTVAAIVLALHERGLQPEVVVPESRSIGGGRRYLDAFLIAGLDVRYVLDAAMEHMLDGARAVLLGAESLRADGSLTNTIGSRPLARLARWAGVAVYGCADLYKLDRETYSGRYREPKARSFDRPLLDGVEVPPGRRVNTLQPELEVVPSELLTAFLTEHGPVPPTMVWQLGCKTFGGGLRESP
jgi:translation initiation factor 2B subunit (eIF-2B alpha/beta/delta family)